MDSPDATFVFGEWAPRYKQGDVVNEGRESGTRPGAMLKRACIGLLLAGFFSGQAIAASDLEVSFTGPEEYTPGTSGIEYELEIHNTGSETDDDVSVEVVFPDGLDVDWECEAPTSSSCSAPASGGGDLDRSGDEIAGGETLTYTFTIAFDSDLTTEPLELSATVTDGDGNAISDSVESELQLEVDLGISKIAADDTYVPGTSVEDAMTITVTNAGPSDAADVQLADDAPDGMSIDAWNCSGEDGASCPSANGTGDIDETIEVTAGGSLVFELDVSYAANADSEELENVATLTIPPALNNPGGETEEDSVILDRDAQVNLSVAFDPATPDSYIPGTGDHEFGLTLANAGLSDAISATVQVTYPDPDIERIDFSCTPAQDCEETSNGDGELEVEINLAADDDMTLQLDVDFDSRALADPLEIEVEIKAHEDDTETESGNTSDTASFEIDRRAGISVEKTATEEETSPAGEFEYEIRVTNHGPGDLGHDPGSDDSVLLDDTFDTLLNGIASECPDGDGSDPCWTWCNTDHGDTGEQGEGIEFGPENCPGEVDFGQGNISDLPLSVAAGNTSLVRVFVSTSPTASGTISNTATIALEEEGPVEEEGSTDDNSDTVEIEVIVESDLAIVKENDGDSTAIAGTEHGYSIIVSNPGFIGAEGVGVVDPFPLFEEMDDAGFEAGTIRFQCQAFNNACCNLNGQCGAGGQPTDWHYADELDEQIDLPAESFVVYTVEGDVDPRSSGTMSNTAEIILPEDFDDPNLDNNVSTVTTDIVADADLRISKTLIDFQPEVGDPPYTLTYQIDVSNRGPSFVADGTVTDALDSDQLAEGTASWYCDVIEPVGETECLTSNPGAPETGVSSVEEEVRIMPGGEVRLLVEVETEASADEPVINTASVSSSAGNAAVTIETNLAGEADLSITKTSNRASIAPGEEIDYVITVENDGPDDVFGASVTDTFPPEIPDIAWSCEATTPVPGDLSFQRVHSPTESGARSAITSPDGRQVYVIAAKDDSGRLFVYDRDPTPGATFGRISLLDTEIEGVSGNGLTVRGLHAPIDVVMTPDGHHVYVLSEQLAIEDEPDETIKAAVATFERNINPTDPDYGKLTFIDRVNEDLPENVRRIATTGDHLYVSGDEQITIFSRDPATGVPEHQQDHADGEVGSPATLVIDHGASLLFAGTHQSPGLTAFAIHPPGGNEPAGSLEKIASTDAAGTNGLVDMVLAPEAEHLYAIAAGESELVMVDYSAIDEEPLEVALQFPPPAGASNAIFDETARLDIAIDGEHVLVTSPSEGALASFRRDLIGGGLSPEEVLTDADFELDVNEDDENGDGPVLGQAGDIVITQDGRHALVTVNDSAAGTLARFSRQAPDPLFAFVEKEVDTDHDGMRSPNDVAVSPDGTHVYAVSLDDDSLSVFTRNAALGLTDDTLGMHLQHLETYFETDDGIGGLQDVRRILISPDGASVFVTSQDRDTLAVFDRNDDEESSQYGLLTFRDKFSASEINALGGAKGMAMDSGSRNLYVAGSFDRTIAIFDRDLDTHGLTYRRAVRSGQDGVSGLSGIRDLVVTSDDEQLLGVSIEANTLVSFARDNDIASPDRGDLNILQIQQSGIGDGPTALAMPPVGSRGAGEHVYIVAENSDTLAILRRVTDPTSSAYRQIQPLAVLANEEDGIESMAGPRDVAISPDGNRVYVAAENDHSVLVFDRDVNESGQHFGHLSLVETRTNRVDGVAGLRQVRALTVSPDSRNVYTVSFGNPPADRASLAAFLLGAGSSCTASGGGNIDDRVNIGVGGTLVYRASGTVSADAMGTLTNIAEVTPPARFVDPDPDNNTDSDIIDLIPAGDIAVIKSHDGTSVVPGERTRFEITITNPGPSNLIHEPDYELTLTDSLDPELFDIDSATWTCEASGSGSLEFLDAHLADAEDDNGSPDPESFASIRNLTGLVRVELETIDGYLPVLAGASVVDDAILLFPLDPVDGSVSDPVIIRDGDEIGDDNDLVSSLAGARSLAASADGRFLYVASRIADSVTVFELEVEGGVPQVNLVEVQDGYIGLDRAVHLILGPGDEHLYVAGSNDDAVAVFNRNASDGRLTFVESEQHGVEDPDDNGGTVDGLLDVEFLVLSPDGSQLYTLSGSSGRIGLFERDSTTGELAWNRSFGESSLLEPTAGIGSAVFDSGGNHLYVAAAGSDRILVLDRNGEGELSVASSVIHGEDGVFGLNGVRHLALTDDDQHLYASSPIGSSVAWFVRNLDNGSLNYGGLRADSSDLVYGLLGAADMVFDAALDQLYVAGSQEPAVSRFERQADSFCTASGTGSIESEPFNIGAGGKITFTIEAEVLSSVDTEVTNTATVTADRDSNDSNHSSTNTSQISRVADLVITKDDGLSEYDGLQGAAAVAGTSDFLYVAGHDDAAISIFRRNDNSQSEDYGEVVFDDVVRDGDAGLTGLNGVSDLALDADQTHLYAVSRTDNMVIVFERDADTGTIEPVQFIQNGVDDVSGLSGAHSLAFSADETHVYVASEFSNSIVVFARQNDPESDHYGRLTFQQRVEEAVDGVAGLGSPAAVSVSPDDRHLYALSRDADTLAVFMRNPNPGSAGFGQLDYIEHYTNETDGVAGLGGARDLALSDDGQDLYALGDDEGTIALFERDEDTGALAFVEFRQDGFGETTGLNNARTIKLSASGDFLYVGGEQSITVYAIDGEDATLSLVDQIANGDEAPLTGGQVFGLDSISDLLIGSSGMHLYATATDADALVTLERGLEIDGGLDFRDILIDGLGGIAPGEEVFYTIVVENLGPSDVGEAVVTDEFPDEFEDVTWSCTSNALADCAPSGEGDLETTVKLLAGGRATFTAGGRIRDDAGGRLINTATVTGAGFLDPNPETQQATDDDTILAPAMNLVVSIDIVDPPAVPGEPIGYEVAVANLGPSYARDVRLQDHLPAALFDTSWECTPDPRPGILNAPRPSADTLSTHRDIVFSPNGRHAYVSGTDGDTAAVATFRRTAIGGRLEKIETLRQGQDDIIGLQGVSALALGPDGRYLYAAASDTDSIVVFQRDAISGELTFDHVVDNSEPGISGLGGVHRLLLSEDGASLYALGGADNALAVFEVDEGDGSLEPIEVHRQGENDIDGLNEPSDMAWSAEGDYLFVTAMANASLSVYQRNPATGTLTRVTTLLDFQISDTADALSAPASIAVSDDNEIFVASPQADRIDRFAFEPDDEDAEQLSHAGVLDSDMLDLSDFDAPGRMVYEADRKRLYVQTSDRIVMIGLMRPAPEVIAIYSGHSELAGLNNLAMGPDQSQLYTLTTELAAWPREQGSRCPVLGENGLGRQTVDIAADGELIYHISAMLQANATGELRYRIDADTPLPEQELNPETSSRANIAVLLPTQDLANEKSADPDPVVAGEAIRYTIDSTNTGPSDALEAHFLDEPPIYPDQDAGMIAGTGVWTCNANPPLDGPTGHNSGPALSDVHFSADTLYATSAEADALIIAPMDGDVPDFNGAQVITNSDLDVEVITAASALTVSADERHVYVTGYQSNTLAVFGRESTEDAFELLEFHQSGSNQIFGLVRPVDVSLSIDGESVYVASRFTGTFNAGALAAFDRDPASGSLEFIEHYGDGSQIFDGESQVIAQIEALQMADNNTDLYTVASGSDSLGHFTRNADSGTLGFESAWRNGEDSENGPMTGLENVMDLATSPGDHHLYALGSAGLALFNRDEDGDLTWVRAWTDFPGMGETRSIHLDPAGTRLYLLDDQAIHVFARDWADGHLVLRHSEPLDGGSLVAGDQAGGTLWSVVGEQFLAWPELAPSRCRDDGRESDHIELEIDLGAGGWSQIVYDAMVHPSARGELVNMASITPGLGVDPYPDNNDSVTITEIEVVSDLAIEKTGPEEAVAGERANFTFVVTNAGPSSALGIGVNDVTDPPDALLDQHWNCTATGNSTCTASGDGGDFTADLLVGDELTIEVEATIASWVIGELVNTAFVVPEEDASDPNPETQSSAHVTDVQAIADVAIAKALVGEEVIAGETIAWTLQVDNSGPSDAPEVAISDLVNDLLEDVHWTCSGSDGGDCPASGSGDVELEAHVPADGRVTVTVEGHLPASATGTIENTATAFAAEPVDDPNLENNEASVSHEIVISPDLALAIDGPEVIDPDGPHDLALTFTVTNHGPSDAIDSLLEFGFDHTVSVQAAAGCATENGGWVCDTGALAAGDSHVIELAVSDLPDAGETLTLSGEVSTAHDDPEPLNNAAEHTVDLLNGPDVMVDIDNHQDSVEPGERVSYEITVTNLGSVTAQSVIVSVPVMNELLDATWSCESVDGVSCTESGTGDIDDTIDIDPGQVVTYRLEGEIDPDIQPTPGQTTIVVQSASATVPDDEDINPDNSNDQDETTVVIGLFHDRFEAPPNGESP